MRRLPKLRDFSITARVTTWYVIVMTLIAAIVFAFVLYMSDSVMEFSAKEELEETVESHLALLSLSEDGATLDASQIEFFINGVYLLVYNEEQTLLKGYPPPNYPSQVPFEDGEFRMVEDAWYIYDAGVELKGYGTVWIRGIHSISRAAVASESILRIFLFSLPLLVGLAVIGGYFLTRRAFAPVRNIIEAADRISNGQDLTERIPVESPSRSRDEIHRLARTVNHMIERLHASFEKEKQFTADVSHELRTPVSVIIAQCEYALEDGISEEERLESLEIAHRQAQRMSKLLKYLLILVRMDNGTRPLTLERVNMTQLIEMVAEEMQPMAGEREIAIHISAQPDVCANLDQTMVMRIFINLISNAIHYGKQGGTITVRMRRRNNWIEAAVEDDGIGIAPEHLDRIWDRFFQANESRHGNDDGSMGLGLAMVKENVETHGGRIRVESTLGEGTTFYVELPADLSI